MTYRANNKNLMEKKMNRQEKDVVATARKLTGRGRMSRRDFIQLAVAAGLSAAAGERLFISAARAEPKKGGSFRIGISNGSTSDSLDPGTWVNAFTVDFGSVFGAELTRMTENSSVEPWLAESFEPNKDASQWVFKLRKGLTFHDGRTLTAADVVETYNYHRSEGSKSAVKGLLGSIIELKADGPETVIFTLKSGNADFPYITSDYHLPIYPAKAGGGIEWEKGISAGPFMLESFQPGMKLQAKRNPNYHVTGAPYFDDVTLLSINDTAARTNALITGEVDYIDDCDLGTIDLLRRQSNIEIDNVTGGSHFVAPMNVTVAPFDNVDVRLALKWAIDREDIIRKVFNGYGAPGNDNPIAPGIKYASQPEPVFKFDPERARFHLKKAGLTTLKVDLSAANTAFRGALDAAALMKNSAAKCGIDINVIREADDGYWDNVWMKKPWCLNYWLGRPTCDWLFSTIYAADASWNDTYWKNPRFNELLVAARSELDEQKRAAMYSEMQQLLHDDGGVLVFAFGQYVSAHTTAVAHGTLHPFFAHDGLMIYEKWWRV